MSATAQAVLNVARSQIGFKEGRNNENPYGKWYGIPNQPYCDMGVTWCAWKAGALDIIPRSANVHSRLTKARAAGVVSMVPKVGSLICFDWDRDGIADHIGFVESVLADGRIQTVEFNTGSYPTGGVARLYRSRSLVIGYIHPRYGTAAKETALAKKTVAAAVRPLVVDGVWGGLTTQHVQLLLKVTPVDKVLGPITVRGLQQWVGAPVENGVKINQPQTMPYRTRLALQGKLKVAKDGILGPVTVKALQRHLNGAV